MVTGHPMTDIEWLLVVTGGHHGDTADPLTEMGCQLGVTPEVFTPSQEAIGCLEELLADRRFFAQMLLVWYQTSIFKGSL